MHGGHEKVHRVLSMEEDKGGKRKKGGQRDQTADHHMKENVVHINLCHHVYSLIILSVVCFHSCIAGCAAMASHTFSCFYSNLLLSAESFPTCMTFCFAGITRPLCHIAINSEVKASMTNMWNPEDDLLLSYWKESPHFMGWFVGIWVCKSFSAGAEVEAGMSVRVRDDNLCGRTLGNNPWRSQSPGTPLCLTRHTRLSEILWFVLRLITESRNAHSLFLLCHYREFWSKTKKSLQIFLLHKNIKANQLLLKTVNCLFQNINRPYINLQQHHNFLRK